MKKLIYLLFVALLVFLLTGPAAFAARTIKIGMIQPLSGVFTENGNQNKNGFFLKMKEAGFKVGEHKIEVILEDDEARPAVGVTKVKKLVEKDKVDITTGSVSSAVAMAVRDYIHEAKRFHI